MSSNRLSRILDLTRWRQESKSKDGNEYGLCSSCCSVVLTDKNSHRTEGAPQHTAKTTGSNTPSLNTGYVHFDYLLKDKLPEFPRLRKGSQDGCRLCNMLESVLREDLARRKDLWKLEFRKSNNVYISLHYHWDDELDSEVRNISNWPPMLSTLDIRIRRDRLKLEAMLTISLDVMAIEGGFGSKTNDVSHLTTV
jgi:hypothetical protein